MAARQGKHRKMVCSARPGRRTCTALHLIPPAWLVVFSSSFPAVWDGDADPLGNTPKDPQGWMATARWPGRQRLFRRAMVFKVPPLRSSHTSRSGKKHETFPKKAWFQQTRGPVDYAQKPPRGPMNIIHTTQPHLYPEAFYSALFRLGSQTRSGENRLTTAACNVL